MNIYHFQFIYKISSGQFPGQKKIKKFIIPLSQRSTELSTSLRVSIQRSLNTIVQFCKLYEEYGKNKTKQEFSTYVKELIVKKENKININRKHNLSNSMGDKPLFITSSSSQSQIFTFKINNFVEKTN